MGQTFVYNSGRAESSKGTLTLTYGMFFDGTLNNRRNTEIRKKIYRIEEYKGETATKEEKEIFDRYAQERKLKYLWLKKTEKDDDSYHNDFSNVARKFMCCDRNNYAIYIEGIGTVDEKEDDAFGFIWGRGNTGVIQKVISGCKKLAAKVNENYNNKINNIIITVDVFGFSRGAAAARNFVYNLQKKAYAPGWYSPPGPYATGKGWQVDHSGNGIKEEWLKEGNLPPMGYLGTELLAAGIDRELVDQLELRVRFLGVYDTVASYDPYNLLPNFKKHIKLLHLHELGFIQKAVHFTAMDEHRENFSLTRLKTGVEKEFPGVHSDIGGSYNSGTEIVKSIENTAYLSPEKLKQFKQELISGYWFKEEQITETGVNQRNRLNSLTGKRELKKEYSYIPLHFMGQYFADTLGVSANSTLIKPLEVEYPVENDAILSKAKRHLEKYVFDKGGKKWEFISDEERNEQRTDNLVEEVTSQIQSSLGTLAQTIESALVNPTVEEEQEMYESIEGIEVLGYDPQYLLRRLRNEYLHWSAERAGVGKDPNTNRKRKEF